MTPNERVVCDLMDSHGLDHDQGWPLLQLLLAKPDPGRDPALVFAEIAALGVIAMSVTDRLDVNWPMLDELQKGKAVASLSFLMSLLDGFTTDEKPRSNNNDNN